MLIQLLVKDLRQAAMKIESNGHARRFQFRRSHYAPTAIPTLPNARQSYHHKKLFLRWGLLG